ncbi:sigma-54 dependent DNA-binding response regulator [Plesiocystis pacifica SIR-1]|uniref:Sigma-54 dependent DNA-binding response regulator n=1 Tax=Plesiocystis pacifica SIR-1 TaxID=391625 RepID=A6FZI9_9BACT|nr:sigma-54 dependent transcriptional regulator [Plesiocystis pacifica]EDM81073.1 sigma-54 dependent DNA-binding response regulator [Plesiocystis pacifica SIR-1]
MVSRESQTVLVVDDEANILEALRKVLTKEGFRVLTAGTGRQALEVLRKQPVRVMITDLRMPGMTGDDLLKAAKAITPEVEVIVMTAYGTVENAVEAMKLGAYDFVSKPLKRATVVAAVRKALDKQALVVENKQLKAQIAQLAASNQRTIIGNSQVMRATLEMARQAANSSATVLLLGESGTGKELMARYIHEQSPRIERPFVATNCAALPESILESELFGHEKGAFTGAVRARAGRFQEADGGSLFLDEIGEIPLPVQVKLLRALQEGEVEPVGGRTTKVDFRLVCATNRDLTQEVKAGRFREDLFYRINVVPIRIPPLRDRLEDVPLLADHFLRMYVSRHGKSVEGISDAALEVMGRYGWPGNVRELENAIERAVVLARGAVIDVDDLPPELRDPQAGHGRQLTFSVGTPLEEVERRMLMETLKFTRGDKRLAADLLGIATRTIYRKLESGQIQDESYTPHREKGDKDTKGVIH